MPRPTPARRIVLGMLAALTIVVGLFVHLALPDTSITDAAGDVLYAVLIYLLVALLLPRRHPALIGTIALAWCVGVELLQLTGLPETWGQAFPPLMLVFGTVFSPWDLLMYALGVFAAAALDAVTGALARTPARDESGGVHPTAEEMP